MLLKLVTPTVRRTGMVRVVGDVGTESRWPPFWLFGDVKKQWFRFKLVKINAQDITTEYHTAHDAIIQKVS